MPNTFSRVIRDPSRTILAALLIPLCCLFAIVCKAAPGAEHSKSQAVAEGVHGPAKPPAPEKGMKHAPGVVLLKLKGAESSHRLKEVVEGYGMQLEVDPIIPELRIYRAHIPPGLLKNGNDEKTYAAVLNANHRSVIDLAVPDEVHEAELTPNDPLYSSQWHLPKINAPNAWNSTTGATTIKIAILDTGVNGSHPDLVGKMVPGWSVYDNSSNTNDAKGHGTMVAGVAAAATNNALGVAGVAWGPKIMPVKIAGANGCTYTSTIAAGLIWAANNGARVANISFSGLANSSLVDIAAYYFQLHHGVVVGAAGLASGGWSSDDPYILSVNATDENDLLASFSMYGDYVDLSAPGVNILTTDWTGGYQTGNGMSFASPIVAGIAALVMSANPTLSPLQVRETIKQTTVDLGTPGFDPEFGSGRVNAQAAVSLALSGGAPPSADVTLPNIQMIAPTAGQTVTGNVSIRYSATDNVGLASLNLAVDGVLTMVDTTPSDGTNYSIGWDSTAASNGQHTLRLEAMDKSFNSTSAQVTVNVNNSPPTTLFPYVYFHCPRSNAILSGTREIEARAGRSVSAFMTVDGSTSLALIGSTQPYRFFWDTTAFANGTHTLRVDAVDNWGNSASNQMTVTVTNSGSDVSGPPWGLLQGPNEITLDDSTPTFNWTDVSDPSGVTYRLLLRNDYYDFNFASPLIDISGIPASTYTLTTPLPNGRYYWTVESVDGAGNIESCWGEGEFEIYVQSTDTIAPPTPTLSSPGNGATITNRLPLFDWSDVTDPSGVSYIIAIDDTVDLSSPLIYDTPFTSNYGPAMLGGGAFPNGTYYWRVMARDGVYNESAWTPIRSVIINSGTDTTAPVAPTLISPANGSRLRVPENTAMTFDWSDVSDPASVIYEISAGSRGQSNLVNSSFTILPTSLPPYASGTYNWQVRAKDGAGNVGPWSSSWTFIIDISGPAAPTLLAPGDGSTTVGATPTLDWSDVTDPAGGVKYRLEIADSNFATELYKVNLTPSTFTPVTALAPGLHYWRVGADDGMGNLGLLGTRFSFLVPGDTTAPAAPQLLSPQNGTSTISLTPTFVWYPVNDLSGVRYRIQVDNSGASFPSPEIDAGNISPTLHGATTLTAGTYSWRIMATDSSGNSGTWSPAWTVAVGQSPPPFISLSSPINGFIDPLEDRDPSNSSVLYGIQNVSITFSAPVTAVGGGALNILNFPRRYLRNGVAATDLQTLTLPTVMLVSGSGAGPYVINFSPRIPLAAWTEITAVNVVNGSGVPISSGGNKIVLGSLPMDIDQDGRILGSDINRWLAIYNNLYDPAPLSKLNLLDQRRDGSIVGSDINRAIQLINGTPGTTLRAWTSAPPNGIELGPKP